MDDTSRLMTEDSGYMTHITHKLHRGELKTNSCRNLLKLKRDKKGPVFVRPINHSFFPYGEQPLFWEPLVEIFEVPNHPVIF